ncbi:MAG TPA: hypothetical protein VN381_13515 [Anaerovoracaceae bacterium]|nr:hypothetical protein [Anaerovoracaceae bacterium]
MAGTAGHTDPESSGAVINLKDYRDAYHYFTAAGKMYDNLNKIYDSALNHKELYRIAADIVKREFTSIKISSSPGSVKKHFTGALTPDRFENDLTALLCGCQKIYLIHVPVGAGSERMLTIFMDSAIYRGLRTEGYYCPTKPAAKLEHLIIPEMGVAFVTSDPYHAIPRSALRSDAEVVAVDLKRVYHDDLIRREENILRSSKQKMDELLEKGIYHLRQAKKGSRSCS